LMRQIRIDVLPGAGAVTASATVATQW